MLDAEEGIPPVDSQESLARYILSKSHVRRQQGTLKPDAFVPHPHTDLSVTRHREASDDELWEAGQAVSDSRGKPLLGRGDVLAATYLRQKLKVVAKPISGNPNHADVSEWPSEKKLQKLIASEVSAVAKYVAVPEPEQE